MLGWYQTLHTLNFLRSRAADTDVQPCRNDFQNCFWAEYRLIGHTLNRQSTRHTTTLSIDSLDTLWTVSLHDIQLHWVSTHWTHFEQTVYTTHNYTEYRLIGHTLNRQSTRQTTTLQAIEKCATLLECNSHISWWIFTLYVSTETVINAIHS